MTPAAAWAATSVSFRNLDCPFSSQFFGNAAAKICGDKNAEPGLQLVLADARLHAAFHNSQLHHQSRWSSRKTFSCRKRRQYNRNCYFKFAADLNAIKPWRTDADNLKPYGC